MQYVSISPLKVSETLSAELYSCVASMFLYVGGENSPNSFVLFFSFLRLKIISGSKTVFSQNGLGQFLCSMDFLLFEFKNLCTFYLYSIKIVAFIL